MERIQGEVKWFNNQKGFGFLGRDNGPDVFVHYTAIQHQGYRSLKEGEPVEFEIGKGPDGKPLAVNVVPLSPAPTPAAE